MKVSFVIPPSGFLIDERVFPSLGILKVAAVLESSGIEVDVIDLSGHTPMTQDLRYGLTESDVIGFTATTPQLPATLEWLSIVRKSYSQARVILGGPHATLTHAALKKSERARKAWEVLTEAFDTIVVGDGELAILDAIKPDAPKLIDGDDRKSPYFMKNEDYDASPLPARHMIDLDSYRYEIEGNRATSLISQLGCPFNCGFCGGRSANSLRVIRNRTSESVIDEIESLYFRGYKGFMFYDDELNVSPGFVDLMERLKHLQERHRTAFRLRGFIKAELFTEDQAKAMHGAGFRWILCGFESADERVLENINKRATIEDNTRVIEIARKHGLKVKALMSLGHPGDCLNTAAKMSCWLIKNRVDDFDCTIITPYPGSPYYDEAVPDGNRWKYTAKSGDNLFMEDVNYAVDADYYKGIPGSYKSYVATDRATGAQLVGFRDRLERRVRATLDIESPAELYEKSMGMS